MILLCPSSSLMNDILSLRPFLQMKKIKTQKVGVIFTTFYSLIRFCTHTLKCLKIKINLQLAWLRSIEFCNPTWTVILACQLLQDNAFSWYAMIYVSLTSILQFYIATSPHVSDPDHEPTNHNFLFVMKHPQ